MTSMVNATMTSVSPVAHALVFVYDGDEDEGELGREQMRLEAKGGPR